MIKMDRVGLFEPTTSAAAAELLTSPLFFLIIIILLLFLRWLQHYRSLLLCYSTISSKSQHRTKCLSTISTYSSYWRITCLVCLPPGNHYICTFSCYLYSP